MIWHLHLLFIVMVCSKKLSRTVPIPVARVGVRARVKGRSYRLVSGLGLWLRVEGQG